MTVEELTAETIGGRDVEAISDAMTRWRILVGRRIISRIALEKLDGRLDLSHADVIKTVNWIARDGEVTVGAIADVLRIDPSRSSRVVAELVEKGMLRRAVSQQDARRAVVELTDEAKIYFEKAEQAKQEAINDVTADWSDADKAAFAALFSRFVSGLEDVARSRGF
ncbi:MarR family winged helix-turn-helix transcriptional regulator [Rhizobium sp. L1K21]|uniref:MarR family winged helix-turn-helix transcriptional regulator n=1 Tax=Rhizobium sp. L1K21 TaxID=2954933 RepID=UPI00209263C2|nr:MarR family transcriptional regulator [Rhizobium sp. L1K21]MCO6185506.1 MarR family transcriptional regulator [Rhizobium sp. L1K21]